MSDQTTTTAATPESPDPSKCFLACDVKIRAIGRARGLRPDEVDDLVHNVYVEFKNNIANTIGNIPEWLRTAAYRSANQLRRQRRRRERREMHREVDSVTPSAPTARVSELEWTDAIARLSSRERRVLLLHLDGVNRELIPQLAGVTHRDARELLEQACERLWNWFN